MRRLSAAERAAGHLTVASPQAEEADAKEATPSAVEDTPVAKRAATTAARPRRAAAAAAQRAIAATAVKRLRGRQMSGASITSVPGVKCSLYSHMFDNFLEELVSAVHTVIAHTSA